MSHQDTAQNNLRQLFTWPDRVLVRDSYSAVEGAPSRLDSDALADLVERYLRLRRTAPNWTPKRYDRNNHGSIDREAIVALLLDAKRLDGDAEPPKKSKRTGRPRVRCVVCRLRFVADRSTARYCSESCKQKAKRGRESGSKGPQSAERGAGGLGPRDTLSPEKAGLSSDPSSSAP